MVSAREFVNGGRIKWEALIGTVIGGVLFAAFEGVISVINRLIDIGLSLLGGLADFIATLVGLQVGTFTTLVASSWAQTRSLVEGSGPLGFAVAIGIVLVTFYVVAEIRGWL